MHAQRFSKGEGKACYFGTANLIVLWGVALCVCVLYPCSEFNAETLRWTYRVVTVLSVGLVIAGIREFATGGKHFAHEVRFTFWVPLACVLAAIALWSATPLTKDNLDDLVRLAGNVVDIEKFRTNQYTIYVQNDHGESESFLSHGSLLERSSLAVGSKVVLLQRKANREKMSLLVNGREIISIDNRIDHANWSRRCVLAIVLMVSVGYVIVYPKANFAK